MQGNADKLREDKNRELREANARNTALLNSLQHRPNRTENGGVSTTAAMEKTAVPEKSFTERMGLFLSGSLEKPMNLEPASNNATPNTKQPEKN
jgi:hypothetical protein